MNDSIKSLLWTALWTFLGVFGFAVTGWLANVAEWASTSGRTPLPGLSVLGYAAVSAIVAAGSGLIAFVVRTAQAKGVLPGAPPNFDGGSK